MINQSRNSRLQINKPLFVVFIVTKVPFCFNMASEINALVQKRVANLIDAQACSIFTFPLGHTLVVQKITLEANMW